MEEERELTKKEIERQDFVDGRIYELLLELAPENANIEWDIEMIAAVRDAVRVELVDKRKLMSEAEFYAYLESEDDVKETGDN